MKIKNITIENYRFFKENELFDFNEKNILLYGENGSGKTSLYNALKDFFFYYKNLSESKTKIKENKNIFCEVIDNPKIEITFEDDTNIKFSETGFDKEDLKIEIEQVSKSKLFLTYQDIYKLNNIFKKDISYKDFKDIFTILYFDDLSDKFVEFEELRRIYEYKLKNTTSREFISDYNKMKELIEEFDFDLLSYELLFELNDKKEIEVAYYLPKEKFDAMRKSFSKIKFFIELCNTLNIEIKDDYWVTDKLEKIDEKVSTLLEENDRFTIDDFNVLERQDFEELTVLDELLKNLDSYTQIIQDYIEITYSVANINDIIFNNFNENIDKINIILDFLDINVKIKDIVEKDYLHYNINNLKIYNVSLKVEISDKELNNHWSNLNEAKLSALNLAIYFSSVLGKKPKIPILVLDDLLISLDMSNRDKILSLLLDRTLNENKQPIFFDDSYQMLIFTHDRAFFELAKYRFDSKASDKWKYFEMYEREKENKYFPFLTESLTYLEKAEKYFVLNEYEIAGNLLRKEAEKFCKEFLPKKYHYSEEYNLKDLNGLIIECINFAKNSDFESDLFEKLDKHRKFVLNPNSHDSYNVMKFRTEIKNCLDTFKELKKLKNQPFLNKGELLEFELTCIKGDLYKFEITLEDDFRLLQKDGNKVISKGLINYRVKKNGTYTEESKHDNCTLEKFYSKNYDKSDKSKNSDFLEEVIITNKRINLKTYITQITL
ncbi:ATP-binding protein [Aliarcobacter cryaerophilus]|uniref:ATP-binding protein n=1 Tax=Aliarcobacter cryaerophilus TaxID=28198 RepID=UPI003174F3A2